MGSRSRRTDHSCRSRLVHSSVSLAPMLLVHLSMRLISIASLGDSLEKNGFNAAIRVSLSKPMHPRALLAKPFFEGSAEAKFWHICSPPKA